MKTPAEEADLEGFTPRLFMLQMQVARRADELASQQATQTPLNYYCWLRAEVEVFGIRPVVLKDAGEPTSE